MTRTFARSGIKLRDRFWNDDITSTRDAGERTDPSFDRHLATIPDRVTSVLPPNECVGSADAIDHARAKNHDSETRQECL